MSGRSNQVLAREGQIIDECKEQVQPIYVTLSGEWGTEWSAVVVKEGKKLTQINPSLTVPEELSGTMTTLQLSALMS